MEKEKEIAYIMNNFNFTKVHRVMEFLGWTWFDVKGLYNDGVPNVEHLRKKAKRLLNESYDNECSIGSGGFYANYNGDKLSLKFVIEGKYYDANE